MTASAIYTADIPIGPIKRTLGFLDLCSYKAMLPGSNYILLSLIEIYLCLHCLKDYVHHIFECFHNVQHYVCNILHNFGRCMNHKKDFRLL